MEGTSTNHDLQASSAPKYKGVVCQSNGRWGAQIYANHRRIWLGTFQSDKEAAMAYDSAGLKLRNGSHSYRNFPSTSTTTHEWKFQSQFTTETVLSMIKDGLYPAKFSAYLRNNVQERESHRLRNENGTITDIRLKHLFQKELTPSDVSNLNRLVIPKRYALKYFPSFDDLDVEENENNMDSIELVVFDRSMRSWDFRYCYWKSSQSYVFTRGWNEFVREKGLRTKDMVIFSSCMKDGQKVFVIDVAYSDDATTGTDIQEADLVGGDEPTTNESENDGSNGGKNFKLFGVQIV